ncbi:MAG: hypothetical protein AAF945_19925 [Actinomycetota bacterium]
MTGERTAPAGWGRVPGAVGSAALCRRRRRSARRGCVAPRRTTASVPTWAAADPLSSPDAPVTVAWLNLAGDLGTWTALGLVSTDDGHGGHLIPFVGTGLRVDTVASDGESGITGWTLAGSAELADDHRIDGLLTSLVDDVAPVFADHPLGAVGLDHVVVSTDDLERTTGAITAATGAPLKRIRELGSIRQGFHRIGPAGLIVEVVEHADSPPGPASFWGVVINVEDLDAACELIGPDLIGQPKDAVQPGRRIATIRRDAGLGTAVALMTP